VRLAPVDKPTGGRFANKPKTGDRLRVGTAITARAVRLIGGEGESLGIVPIEQALSKASQSGLDLVEISPNASPPVCKLLDHGKYRYQEQKKRTAAKRRQKSMDVKEIKFRPHIGDHDFEFKLSTVERFLKEGSRVKISLRFRGREMAYTEHGKALMERILERFGNNVKTIQEPQIEGRQMVMVLAHANLAGEQAKSESNNSPNSDSNAAPKTKTKTDSSTAPKADTATYSKTDSATAPKTDSSTAPKTDSDSTKEHPPTNRLNE